MFNYQNMYWPCDELSAAWHSGSSIKCLWRNYIKKSVRNVNLSFACLKISRGIAESTEKILRANFKKLFDRYKQTTLWSKSMLKPMINLRRKSTLKSLMKFPLFSNENLEDTQQRNRKYFPPRNLTTFWRDKRLTVKILKTCLFNK